MTNDPYNDYLEALTNGTTISQKTLDVLHTMPENPCRHVGRRDTVKSRKYYARLNADRFLDGPFIGPCDRR